MLVYDIESRGAPAPLDQNNILTEQLKKLQIPGLSEEILQKIYAHPQAKLDFARDINAISSQIPPNPSEISRMDFYIKGYGQEVTLKDGSKLSFADVAKMGTKEQDTVIEQISDDEADKIERYIREMKNGIINKTQVAIEEGKKIDQGTQVVIEENKEKLTTQQEVRSLSQNAENTNKNLQSQIESIQKINGVPKPNIEELKKTAQTIPELQGVTTEEIQSSDKYNNILLANYYINNAKEISQKLTPSDLQIFQNSIDNLSDTMRRPRIKDFEKLTSSIGLGPNRDKVEGLGKELIKNGYSENVVWNSGDRTISFSNGRGEKRIIETASIPPRERMDRGNLSISREVTENSPDPARIRNDGKRADAKKLTKSIGDQTMEVLSAETSDKKKVLNPSIAGLMSNTLNFVTLDTPESAAFSKNMINVGINTIKMEQDDLTKLVEEKTRANPLDPDIGTIRGVITRLTALSDSMKSLVSKTNIEKEDDQKNPAIWENSARNNLDWMTDAYMDNIGPNAQSTIDRIIGLVNKDRNKGNQISLGEPLSTTSKDILQRSIAKLGGTPEVLTSGDRLPSFQRKISEALRYSPSHRDSIESILKAPANPETPPTTTL